MRCRPAWEAVVEVWSPEMIERAQQLLDEGEAAATQEPHKQRIRFERRVFQHTMFMRHVYHLHLARQKLEAIGDAVAGEGLLQKQERILNQALDVDLPKHFSQHWIRDVWLR